MSHLKTPRTERGIYLVADSVAKQTQNLMPGDAITTKANAPRSLFMSNSKVESDNT
jgi:hypothetical protein